MVFSRRQILPTFFPVRGQHIQILSIYPKSWTIPPTALSARLALIQQLTYTPKSTRKIDKISKSINDTVSLLLLGTFAAGNSNNRPHLYDVEPPVFVNKGPGSSGLQTGVSSTVCLPVYSRGSGIHFSVALVTSWRISRCHIPSRGFFPSCRICAGNMRWYNDKEYHEK